MHRVRTSLAIVLTGGLLGALTVGVLSRAAMFLLADLNPAADGVTSDDGFEMGRFTLAGSLNLLGFGVLIGLVSGALYLVLERLRFGPGWFRVVSLGVGAGLAAASQVVHTDGVDFTLLGPVWLTVGLFAALPILHVCLLEVAAVRIRTTWGSPVVVGSGPLAWAVRAVLLGVFVVALASLVGDVRALSSGPG